MTGSLAVIEQLFNSWSELLLKEIQALSKEQRQPFLRRRPSPSSKMLGSKETDGPTDPHGIGQCPSLINDVVAMQTFSSASAAAQLRKNEKIGAAQQVLPDPETEVTTRYC